MFRGFPSLPTEGKGRPLSVEGLRRGSHLGVTMNTKDTDLLFQTSEQLRDAAQRKKKFRAAKLVGSPIEVNGKILDMHICDEDVWLAESGWQARRVNPESGTTKQIFKAHRGPVTSLATIKTAALGKATHLLFTGSWDKTINIWNADTGGLVSTLDAHADFVKSLTIIPCSPILLLSTSSDRTVRIWSLGTLSAGGSPECVQVIRAHSRPVECSAVRPEEDGRLRVWTGDSLGLIKEWIVTDGRLSHVKDITAHHTSVVALLPTEAGLWSASMDKTAIFHAQDGTTTTLEHPSYVKSLAIVSDRGRALLVTGCSDEEIRVWDGDAAFEGEARLLAVVPGHCDEVSALATTDQGLLSGSLDQTMRRWTIDALLHPVQLRTPPPAEGLKFELSAEEEAELAELLSDSE